MDIHEIKKLSALARIKLSDDEEKKMLSDMEDILVFVEQIKAVDTSSVSTLPPLHVYNVLREDENPHESGIHTDAILAVAPETQDGFVKVKKIL